MIKTRRILCIDDDLMTLDLLKACLCPQDGFDVEIAISVADGLEMARKQKPDAILLDGTMQGVCGLDALRLVHGEPSLICVPIFMVTGRNTREHSEREADSGATGYFTKPINPILLANRLDRVLSRTGQAA